MKAFEAHNHKTCRDTILYQVEVRAKKEGLRLTDIRRRVLCKLLESHRALGAYEILNQLVAEGEIAQPPIVYRALDFLTKNGFAHKVESCSSYMACQYPDRNHRAGLLICRNCRVVGECCVYQSVLATRDFHVENEVLEAEGLCKNCYEAENGIN